MAKKIKSHRELRVYQAAMDLAVRVFERSKDFPAEEKYALTDQMRRSSRSVCANLAEAWRKRRYEKHFVSKLSDAESEAEETRVWIEIAFRCGYLDRDEAHEWYEQYDHILAQLVLMIRSPEKWTL